MSEHEQGPMHEERPAAPRLLREGHNVARLASWEWDPADDTLRVADAGALDALGVEAASVATMTAALHALVDPRDREAVCQALLAVCESAEVSSVRYRARLADRGVEWLEMRVSPVLDPDGEVARIRGTTQDVTEQERASRRERRLRDFYQDTVDSLTAHVAVLDENGFIVSTNRAWDRFAEENGGTPGPGANYLDACDAAPEVAEALHAILRGERDEFETEYDCHSADEERYFVMRASRFRSAGPARAVVQHENVTQRRRAEHAARLRAELLDAVDAAVMATDRDGIVTEWNCGAERLYGWRREEAVGRRISALELFADDDGGTATSDADALSGASGDREARLTVRRKDGTTFPAAVRETCLRDAAGRSAGLVGVSVDITEHVQREQELAAARDYMRAVTDSMVEGVCTLDIDGDLVYMNRAAEDMLGWSLHELVGRNMHRATHHRRHDHTPLPIDECPILRARRDGEVVRNDDDIFVRRDGTDLPVEYIASPFRTAEGVRGTVIVFSDISERKAEQRKLEAQLERMMWAGRVKEALAYDRFVLFAQPIIEIATGETVQHELLIRMRDGDDGLVAPGQFLPVAEEFGLIAEIDRWVIAQAAKLAGCGHPVELNVSARSLGDPHLADVVERELHAAGADPRQLVFELTETALLDSDEHGRDFIRRLERLGCKVALDDFGTGYGGFTYLKRLPVDYLKIDIEFVRDLPRDPASRHVVAAVVSLARGFGQKTVAEGVEDDETLACLRELGVDYAQGFGIGRPAPVEAALAPLAAARAAA